MEGTILLTGANGSLAVHAVRHLLSNFPDYTLLLTVRDASDANTNLNELRAIISTHPAANVSIRQLDLSKLQEIRNFAGNIQAEITDGRLPPLRSIVCNAFYWNLVGDMEFTEDGFEKTFQINHLAHAALVLQLIGSFPPAGGRIVLFASDAHWPGQNSLEKYPPTIPDDLDLLVHPGTDKTSDNLGWGVQRYGRSKLAIVMWMYALNRYLQANQNLSRISAIAINPGNLSDSRALRVNTPGTLQFASRFFIPYMAPLLRFKDPTMRTSSEAGLDIAELAGHRACPGEHGYFTLLKKDESSPDSRDEQVQEKLWVQTTKWTGVTLD